MTFFVPENYIHMLQHLLFFFFLKLVSNPAKYKWNLAKYNNDCLKSKEPEKHALNALKELLLCPS